VASSKLRRLQRLIEKHPNNAYLYQLLGKLYRKRGKFKEMAGAWEHSLRLDPCDPWIHMFLGNMYFGRGDWENAIERFSYAAMLMPDRPAPIWSLADVFERQGRLELADEYHRRSCEIDPDDEQARRLLNEFQERREGRGAD
jgi:protein O-mannosyl-transferase